MNKVLMTLIFTGISLLGYPFTGGRAYILKGTTEIKEGKAILKQDLKSDTVQIKNGNFEFKGTINKPVLALLELQPLGGVPVTVIVEPGVITLTEKSGLYIVGGSVNNNRLQYIHNQLIPYTSKIQLLREQSYQARGNDQKKLLQEIEIANREKTEKAGRLVKADSGFAEYITLLSFYRKASATEIIHYLKEFRFYSGEQGYKEMKDYYAGMPKADVGLAAPVFTLQNTAGIPVSLSAFRGKYVLLDFWFTDCGFCRKQAPGMVRLYADLKDKGFEIVSISIDAAYDKGRWQEAIKQDGATWTELLDYDKTLPDQYGIEGYPTLFLLDQQGMVLQKLVGYQDEKALRDVLGKYIKS
jgi:peroxiredoxin